MPGINQDTRTAAWGEYDPANTSPGPGIGFYGLDLDRLSASMRAVIEHRECRDPALGREDGDPPRAPDLMAFGGRAYL